MTIVKQALQWDKRRLLLNGDSLFEQPDQSASLYRIDPLPPLLAVRTSHV